MEDYHNFCCMQTLILDFWLHLKAETDTFANGIQRQEGGKAHPNSMLCHILFMHSTRWGLKAINLNIVNDTHTQHC